MKLFYMLIIFALTSSYGWAQNSDKITIDQAQTEVRDIFRQVVDIRRNTIKTNSIRVTELPKDTRNFGQGAGLAFEDGLFKLAEIITNNYQIDSAPVYRSAIITEMKSNNPFNRGLACQLVRLNFDIDFVYALGQLIDDSTPSIPVMIADTPQIGPTTETWVEPTVGQMARLSLLSLICMEFTTKEDFNYWWNANKDYKDKLWYWSAKWSRRNNYVWVSADGWIRPIVLPVRIDNKVLENDLQILAKMPGDTGLKILLLHDNILAKQYEAFTSVGMDDITAKKHLQVMNITIDSIITRYDLVVKYAKDHNLKSRLMELMRKENLYPEVKSSGYDVIYRKIYAIGEKIFTSDDEPVLAEMQNQATDHNHINSLALLRAKLSPEKADTILISTLNKYPELYDLALTYIVKYGTADHEILMKSFNAITIYERARIIECTYNAAKRGLPVSAAFIVDIAKSFNDLVYEQNSNYYPYVNIITHMAQTANIIKGIEIIPIEKILEPYKSSSKFVNRDVIQDRYREFPKVFITVRDTLISELQK